MDRIPCTCKKGNPLCAACVAWNKTQQIPLEAKRGGKHVGGTPVLDRGRLTYTRYSAGTIRLVQRLYTSGMLLDAVAVRTGVPYGSVRRIVHMELVKENA